MKPIEILVIVIASLIVVGVLISTIIRKKKGKTSCGCDCSNCSACSHCKSKNNIDKT